MFSGVGDGKRWERQAERRGRPEGELHDRASRLEQQRRTSVNVRRFELLRTREGWGEVGRREVVTIVGLVGVGSGGIGLGRLT